MAKNYKYLYAQMKQLVEKYQDEIVPKLQETIDRLRQQRPMGRWEPRTDVVGFARCSVCHDCNIYDDWADGKKWKYCPNCGAEMAWGEVNKDHHI